MRIGYFDQKLGTLNEELSLIDEIRTVRADLSPEVGAQYLAKFRFFGDDPFRTVRGLSGGERSRLAMAKIMLFPRNVLVLDEPTNHLDIPARETLEEALTAYEGTLIVVSHDRYFLDRICTRLLVIEGTHVEAHLGNYSDWRRRKRGDAPRAPRPPAVAEAAADAKQAGRPSRRPAAAERDARQATRSASSGAGDAAWKRWRRMWASWRRSWRPCGGAGRRSRRRLAEAAHAGRPRARARRALRAPDGGVGDGAARRPSMPASAPSD